MTETRAPQTAEDLERLIGLYGHLDGSDLLEAMIKEAFPGGIAVSSSFGIEAAVLLDMVARIDPATPIVFLDTGVLFEETIAYKDVLEKRLGLTDIRTMRPLDDHIQKYDPDETLHETDSNLCCHIRKVLPMQDALHAFDAWVTGRKRFHGGERTDLPALELDQGQIKVNPLINYDRDKILEEFTQRGLPIHALELKGYTSVGCHYCTGLPVAGDDVRSGRWSGQNKTECGIHKAPWFGADI